MTEKFIAVAKAGQIIPGRGLAVSVAGTSVAIFNLGDELVAVDNKCPHQGAPLASAPVVGKTRVRCALHGWLIDLKCTEGVDGLRRFNVRQNSDGVVEVAVTAIPCEVEDFEEVRLIRE